MNRLIPEIRPMGERAILINFPQEISEKLLDILIFHKNRLQEILIEEKVEVANTYTSLLIHYTFDIEDVYSEVLRVKEALLETNIPINTIKQIFHIPVCYELQFGVDLEHISMEKNISVEDVITRHTASIYTVYFIGFLPGFLYLGGLDNTLQIARKNSPRKRVEKGAVGIGENQTGIYPKSSPGGWQIIGNSPIEIFNKNCNPPCQIPPGDKIKFYSVSLEEYEKIKSLMREGKFHLKKELYDG